MATWRGGLLGGELSGRTGNAVLVRTARGTVVGERPTVRVSDSPAAQEARARQRAAAKAWTDLEPEAVARWTAWARGIGRQPNNAFATLYKVLLRLDSGALPPQSPPARPFFGDVIEVGIASPSPDGSFGRGSRGERLPEPPPPAPSSITNQMEEGEPSVGFASSGANAAGVVTELLVQPLASRHRRTYLERYRHAAYVRFEGAETVAVPAPSGWVALAYRFVGAGTGEVTAIAELGVVRAG